MLFIGVIIHFPFLVFTALIINVFKFWLRFSHYMAVFHLILVSFLKY